MLNVNMDKHPHGINERRMANLKKREGWYGKRGTSTLPHLTHECFVEVPIIQLVDLTKGGSQAKSQSLTVKRQKLQKN